MCAPLSETLRAAIAEISITLGPDPSAWRWGDLHVAAFGHPLLRGLGAARIAQPGDGATVFRGGLARGGWASVHGPAFRGVYDLADLDSSVFSVAPGQSGNIFSPLARNMLTRWRDGASTRLDVLRTEPSMRLKLLP